MAGDQLTDRLQVARKAVLATADVHGRPHLVPIVFAWDDGHIYSAVDHKPKSTTNLKRLRNIRENPRVSVLVDSYDEDWTALWWIRADGRARLHDDGERFERAELRAWSAGAPGPGDSADRP